MSIEICRKETHDRLLELKKNGTKISEYVSQLVQSKPFGNVPFYIFVHSRTEENKYEKRLLYQPRLTKPEAQENSMLFKAFPSSDQIKIFWMIPQKEMWSNYERGKVCESNIVLKSINRFKKNKKKLSQPEPDDLSDEKIRSIYLEQFGRKL